VSGRGRGEDRAQREGAHPEALGPGRQIEDNVVAHRSTPPRTPPERWLLYTERQEGAAAGGEGAPVIASAHAPPPPPHRPRPTPDPHLSQPMLINRCSGGHVHLARPLQFDDEGGEGSQGLLGGRGQRVAEALGRAACEPTQRPPPPAEGADGGRQRSEGVGGHVGEGRPESTDGVRGVHGLGGKGGAPGERPGPSRWPGTGPPSRAGEGRRARRPPRARRRTRWRSGAPTAAGSRRAGPPSHGAQRPSATIEGQAQAEERRAQGARAYERLDDAVGADAEAHDAVSRLQQLRDSALCKAASLLCRPPPRT